MTKIFRGVTPAARPLRCVWSIMKPILRFSVSIIKDWSDPPSLQVSPLIKSLAGHRNSIGSTTPYIRSKHSGAEQIVVDFHRSSDRGLDVRNPHSLELVDSVSSVFFTPVGNTMSDYQPGDGGSGTYLVSQHLTAFDGDNTAGGTATHQRTAGAAPAGSVSPVTATGELLCASGVCFR